VRNARPRFSSELLHKKMVLIEQFGIETADQREAHNRSPNPIADSPYFHPHSFVEFLLRCQLGVLNLERVLPSRRELTLYVPERPPFT
jgi:hypothetical protein